MNRYTFLSSVTLCSLAMTGLNDVLLYNCISEYISPLVLAVKDVTIDQATVILR